MFPGIQAGGQCGCAKSGWKPVSEVREGQDGGNPLYVEKARGHLLSSLEYLGETTEKIFNSLFGNQKSTARQIGGRGRVVNLGIFS